MASLDPIDHSLYLKYFNTFLTWCPGPIGPSFAASQSPVLFLPHLPNYFNDEEPAPGSVLGALLHPLPYPVSQL